MAYPLEASDVQRFTPPSLAALPNPPVFLLRAATTRDRNTFQTELVAAGFRSYDQAELRAETLRGLKANWSPAHFERFEPRIKAYWDAIDQYSKEYGDADNPPPFEHEDDAMIRDLLVRLTDVHEPLRRMGAQNMRHQLEAPAIILSLVLSGWENLDIAFELEAGRAPLALVELVESELYAIEEANAKVEGVGLPRTAWFELCAAAGARLYLQRSAEKNSSSPPPSPPIPEPLPADGLAPESGLSMASASSTETPAS